VLTVKDRYRCVEAIEAAVGAIVGAGGVVVQLGTQFLIRNIVVAVPLHCPLV
jgi:hypothetical protein